MRENQITSNLKLAEGEKAEINENFDMFADTPEGVGFDASVVVK
jgi:uncharacterized protein (UPF0335 family)